jgi:hypothetical protein
MHWLKIIIYQGFEIHLLKLVRLGLVFEDDEKGHYAVLSLGILNASITASFHLYKWSIMYNTGR